MKRETQPHPISNWWAVVSVVVGVVCGLWAASMVNGCASTPREQYANLNDSYIAAVSTLVDARMSGIFDDEEWEEDILPLILLGDTLLDRYDAATDAGSPTEPYTTRLERVIRALQPFIVEAISESEE